MKEKVLVILTLICVVTTIITMVFVIKTNIKMENLEKKVDNMTEIFYPNEEGWQIEDYNYLSDPEYEYSENYDENPE